MRDTAARVETGSHVRILNAHYAAWASGTWHAPVSNHAGLPAHRNLAIVGVERRYLLTFGLFGSFSFSPSLIPGAFTTGNRRQQPTTCGGTALPNCFTDISYTAFGVGIIPASIAFDSPSLGRFRGRAEAGGGALLFDARVPSATGTQFNFLARAGGDIAVKINGHSELFVGYRHLHISNGGLGTSNAGIDAPTLVVGGGWQ